MFEILEESGEDSAGKGCTVMDGCAGSLIKMTENLVEMTWLIFTPTSRRPSGSS